MVTVALLVTSLNATKFAPMTRNCLLRHVYVSRLVHAPKGVNGHHAPNSHHRSVSKFPQNTSSCANGRGVSLDGTRPDFGVADLVGLQEAEGV